MDFYGNELDINTASFITFGQTYEMLALVEKGGRKAYTKIEVEMLAVPTPIVSIECASFCFPGFNGVYINPSTRIALRGS